jgi:hypothetical protein
LAKSRSLFGVAAKLMRRILMDHARARRRNAAGAKLRCRSTKRLKFPVGAQPGDLPFSREDKNLLIIDQVCLGGIDLTVLVT